MDWISMKERNLFPEKKFVIALSGAIKTSKFVKVKNRPRQSRQWESRKRQLTSAGDEVKTQGGLTMAQDFTAQGPIQVYPDPDGRHVPAYVIQPGEFLTDLEPAAPNQPSRGWRKISFVHRGTMQATIGFMQDIAGIIDPAFPAPVLTRLTKCAVPESKTVHHICCLCMNR